METQTPTLWEIIQRVGQAMPLSKDRFEAATGVALELVARDAYSARWQGPGFPLAGGVRAASASLINAPGGEFDATSRATLELAGDCIEVSEVRRHFPTLTISSPPRGRSIEEPTVFTAHQPWGAVSFRVKQHKNDCVVSVSFSKGRG